MLNWKRYIPEGTRDILFEECSKKVEIENVLRKVYIDSGFLEVISPTLEFYDVFNEKNATLPQEKMYKLFDTEGRILILRPDMTTPIARIVATKLNDGHHPLKVCYSSNVYRLNESLNGKNSEFTQSGIEIIGVKGVKADAEVIITGITALLECGLKDFKVELGQAEFFKAFVEDVNLADEDKERLRKYIENKNLTALMKLLQDKEEKIDGENLSILKELPKLFGDIKVLDKAAKLTNNAKALEALESVRKVYEIVESIGLSQYIAMDLGMVQDLNYYTGIIFKGYAHGVGGNILSGGRYDKLISQFGDDEPATGLAIDVDSILLALASSGYKEKEERERVLIYCKEGFFKKAYDKAMELRRKNVIAEISLLDSEEEAVEYAKRKGINRVINIEI
jgi:ATP phosphoribosyltransferase regulatory subunit